MSSARSCRRAVLCLLPAALLLSAAAAVAEPIGVRSVPADPLGSVRVSDLSGSVVVSGWPQARVRLTGRIGRDASGARLEEGAGGVSVGVVVPEGLKPNAEVAGHLVVNAPEASSLAVDSTSASVRVDRMSGPMSLSSVTGQIFVTVSLPLPPPDPGAGAAASPSPESDSAPSSSGSPRARTASLITARSVAGAVLVYGRLPEVAASTVGGSIDLRGTMPAISVQTTKGEVRIVDALLREGRVSSIAGAIYLWCRLPAGAHLVVKSLSGLIFLRLTPDSEPRIAVTSYSGRLSTNRLLDRGRSVRLAPGAPGEAAIAVLGSGSSSVSVTDFAGDIILTNEPPPERAK